MRGFVINRFRGDPALLQSGLDWLENETGTPVVGVLPYLQGLHLDAEDALNRHDGRSADAALRVVVPALPRISNHTDFDPLRLHPQVDLHYVGPGETPPPADVVILPGSKSVRADRDWLAAQGWDAYLRRHLRYGGKLIGICGGFQMLGRQLHDPDGVEGAAGSSAGLALLDMETVLAPDKQLRNVRGRLTMAAAPLQGYEIHAGVTTGPALKSPAVLLDDGRSDGAVSDDGQVLGTYLHGLFDSAETCRTLLAWAGLEGAESDDHAGRREAGIDAMADAVAAHLDPAWLHKHLLDTRAETVS